MFYSLWYIETTMLPAGSLEAEFLRFQASGRQHRGCIIPQAVTQQSSVPEDGQNSCPKLVELFGIINKPLLLHLFGFLYYSFILLTDECRHVTSNS